MDSEELERKYRDFRPQSIADLATFYTDCLSTFRTEYEKLDLSHIDSWTVGQHVDLISLDLHKVITGERALDPALDPVLQLISKLTRLHRYWDELEKRHGEENLLLTGATLTWTLGKERDDSFVFIRGMVIPGIGRLDNFDAYLQLWEWLKDQLHSKEIGLFDALRYWAEKTEEEIITAGLGIGGEAWLSKSFHAIVRNKLVDQRRKENPQFAALWRETRKKNKPRNQAERLELLNKTAMEYDKMFPSGEAPLSLDKEVEGKKGETYVPGGLLEDKHGPDFIKGLEDRDELYALVEKAKLPRKQWLVIDLTREGKSDRSIALALEREFGRRSSEGNVRKLKHDAIERLRKAAEE